MTTENARQQEPITDSPWFWVYLFAAMALILLVLFRAKLEQRQSDIERQHQARQQTTQVQSSAKGNSEITSSPDQKTLQLASPGNTLIGLNFIFLLLGALILVGWVRLWYVRLREQQAPIVHE